MLRQVDRVREFDAELVMLIDESLVLKEALHGEWPEKRWVRRAPPCASVCHHPCCLP